MSDFNATQELTEAGQGLGAFLDALADPLGGFLLAVGIIGGILGIFRSVASKIRESI